MRDEYFCPNCEAILNDQYGFDPDKGSWTCTKCGMHLMDDDVYEGDTFEGVAWYCDDCGAFLNRQSGFYDYCGSWICTECGHSNPINEDEIIGDDDKDDEEEDETYFASYTSSQTYNNSKKTSNNYSNYQTRNVAPKRKDRSWIVAIVAMLLLIAIPAGILLKFEIDEKKAINEGKINAGYYRDLVGENYKTVEAHFRAAGFTNIELIDLNDSGIAFWKDEKVATISVGGDTTFEETDWFDPDVTVVISYH